MELGPRCSARYGDAHASSSPHCLTGELSRIRVVFFSSKHIDSGLATRCLRKNEAMQVCSTPEGTCDAPLPDVNPAEPAHFEGPKCQCWPGHVRHRGECIPVWECPGAGANNELDKPTTTPAAL